MLDDCGHNGLTSQTSEEAMPSIRKAGCIVYGKAWASEKAQKRGDRPQYYVLMNYSEGRFGEGWLAPHIPKGSVNSGEAPEKAAYRETLEETGFNVAKALRGEISGVKVKSVSPRLVEYTSSHGKTRLMQLMMVELADGAIAKLGSKDCPLKGRIKRNGGEVKPSIPTALMVEKRNLPDLDDMIDVYMCGWMQTGTQKRAHQVIRNPVLPEMAEKYNLPDYPDAEDWITFNDRVYAENRADYDRLQKDYRKVRDKLEQRRIIGDRNRLLKQDIHDCPGNFFTEVSSAVPFSEAYAQALDAAERSPLYHRAHMGDGTKTKQMDIFFDVLHEIDPMAFALAATKPNRYMLPGGPAESRHRQLVSPRPIDEAALGERVEPAQFGSRRAALAHVARLERLAVREANEINQFAGNVSPGMRAQEALNIRRESDPDRQAMWEGTIRPQGPRSLSAVDRAAREKGGDSTLKR